MSRARALLGFSIVVVCLVGTTMAPGQPEYQPLDGGTDAAAALGTPPEIRGVALGLFADSPSHDYTPQLREIAALGSTHVAVVVTWFQNDVYATEIVADPSRTPTMETIRATLRTARRLGLGTMLFPYVRVDQKIEPHHWRGCLEPRDRAEWFRAYGEWIESLAVLAASEDVEILSLGSEMSSVDVDTEAWIAMIQRVRGVFPGRVTYSANWDHYQDVRFWEHLDIVGMTGYFELVAPDRNDPTPDEVCEGWREWYIRLIRWQNGIGRPILLTEVGYRSNDGAASAPWRWGEEENRVDLKEQRMLYEAVARIWSDESRLLGIFFWNWWGEGGASCHDYTPRGKPAAGVLRHWFGAGRES